MGPAYGTRAGGAYVDYYMCVKHARRACSAPRVRVDATDALVEVLVLARLGELSEELGRDDVVVVEEARPRRPADLEARRERVLDLYERGAIDEGQLKARLERIDTERAATAVAEARAATRERARRPELRRELLKSVEGIGRGWRGLTIAERREHVVRLLVARVELRAGASPRVTWRPVEELLSED